MGYSKLFLFFYIEKQSKNAIPLQAETIYEVLLMSFIKDLLFFLPCKHYIFFYLFSFTSNTFGIWYSIKTKIISFLQN